MTELQRLEFEMLKIFVDICEKLNLKYYLVCGSCLGAVKYNGFIPWDDDVDVALLRDEYDTFCKYAPEMLPDFIFLQNCHTDKEYPLYMGKLRNCNTTFIENLYSNIMMNHGVYIDIFPLDGYPSSESEIKRIEKEKVIYQRHRGVKYKYNRFSLRNIVHVKAIGVFIMYKLFGYCQNTQKVVTRFEKVTKQYDCRKSILLCNHDNWQGKLEYASREQYGEGTWATFEGLKVRIPENFDAYLTQKYGNWRADLPDEMKIPSHGHLVDLTRPYTDYIEKLPRGRIRIKKPEELN